MKKQFGAFEVKSLAEDGNGLLAGYGSVAGNVDGVGDIVAPGAYGDLTKLRKDGALLLGHDWGSVPIGYFKTVQADEKGLYVEAEFHSTDQAQAVRKTIAERLAAGCSAGLSIGYFVTDSAMEMRDGNMVRVLKGIEVVEVSVVNVPANREALVTSVKAEPGTGSRLDEQVSTALGLVEDLASRYETFDSDRKQGLSPKHREQIQSLVKGLTDLQAKGVEPEPEPELVPVPDDLVALALTLQQDQQ